ncbi:MAG: type II secretion system F family protein [Ignavibacteriales bacterium]
MVVEATEIILLIPIIILSYILANKILDREFRKHVKEFSESVNSEYQKKQIINKILRRDKLKKKAYKSLFYKIELIIEKSGIQNYVLFFNSTILIITCIIFAIGFFLLFTYLFDVISVGLITSLPGFFVPIIILGIMAQKKEEEIEKILADYLLLLKNSTRIHNDIIEAFRNIQDKCMEPLKTFTCQFTAEINSGINVESALSNFRDKINMKKFKLFLTNVQYCYIYGGDFTELIDKTQKLISEIQKEKRIRIRETRSARIVIFLLIFLDIYLYFNFIMTEPDYLSIMRNTFYGQLILNANFLSIWFLLWLSYSVKKLDY